jgi:uridylate kinase
MGDYTRSKCKIFSNQIGSRAKRYGGILATVINGMALQGSW